MSVLSAQQIEQFRTKGYCVAANVFSPREVAALQADVERLKGLGKLRNVTTEGDGKTHSTKAANLQICPMSPHSTLIRALPFHDKVISAVGELIGDPFMLHLDQCFLKPARNGAGTSWHQDNAYFKIPEPLKGTAMWIAVHDATIANGTLNIVPSRMHDKLEHSRDPNSDHHIRCYPDESEAVPCEVKAGGAVFFAYGTPHCTRGNGTDKDRAGVALHFLRTDQVKSLDEFNKNNPHPILSGPDASDGTKEYGVRSSGTWEKEVAALLDRQTVGA
jgi:ectoine hydroxylase-related dioxygenase (phytanoyl-CoA dioxygenase family)